MKRLKEKLQELQDYSRENEVIELTKRIYDLDLPQDYLQKLSQLQLRYIHVRLHNALSYKKPFADISEIKKVHSNVVKNMFSHQVIDQLDEEN